MPMVTPSLNLAQPVTSTAVAKAATPQPAASVTAPISASLPAPSTTVTLSPQAMSAMAAASHPSPSPSPNSAGAAPAPAAHDGSVYESLKNGITTAVADVGDAIEGGAHAVVDGVETVLSTANNVAKGILELPFAALSKASDAVGALIDEL